MSGSPLRQLLLALAGFILLGLVLLSATRPAKQLRSSSQEIPPSAKQDQIPAFMSVKYAHKPSSLRISLKDGKSDIVLYEGTPDTMNLEESIDLPMNPTGKASLTLMIEAKWNEGTPDTPISITLEPDQRPAQTSTAWSTGATLHNTFPFSW